jgi:methionyl-tRNA formyltransferase
LRIVFLGSPAFAVPAIEALVRDGYDVAAVFTQPDRPAGRGRALQKSAVKAAAERLGLPVHQPERISAPEGFAQLAFYQPDAVVICAYGQILSQAVIDLPPRQTVNVHFSLLPRHRGASPAAAAILAGDAFTGVTVQLVRKKLDTGPLLAAASVPISDDDTTLSLLEKLSVVGAELLSEALAGWLRGEREPRPQEEAAQTYFSQIRKEAGRIDWSLPAVTLWRQVRAYHPWPGSFTTWRGRTLKITAARPLPGGAAAPGTVRLADEHEMTVQTGEGRLQVERLQLAGKQEMTPAQFYRGHADIAGEVLPS